MTNIDFGTLVSTVVEEMNMTRSEFLQKDYEDADVALGRYKRNVISAIRKVFDDAEADAPAPVVPTCSNCGAVLGETARFCGRCRMPLSEEAAVELLEDLLVEGAAKDVGMSPDDPRLRASLARVREEMPEEWTALVQKLTAPACPKNDKVETA